MAKPIIYEPRGKAREYAPLAINLYTGCEHACRFCYVPAIMRTTIDRWSMNPKPRSDVLKQLARDIAAGVGMNDGGLLNPENRDPLLLCFMCDPYQPCERNHRITRQSIEMLGNAGYRLRVLTKGGDLAARDLDLFERYRVEVGVTLHLSNEQDREYWEPGASTLAARWRLLEDAQAAGCPTWISIEPVVYPDQSLDVIRRGVEYGLVDVWKIGKLNHNHDHEANIDWQAFLAKTLEALGPAAEYYIKNDLWKYANKKTQAQFAKTTLAEQTPT